MQSSDIKKILAEGLERMDLHLLDRAKALERLVLHFQELKKWNRKVNLVARTMEDSQILENHFLDSLSLLTVLNPGNGKVGTVLDVGTGAGFPGMVLKTACPEWAVVLIEPRKNRFYFLKHLVRILGLDDVELLNVRLDDAGQENELSGREFSFITSRAFTDISNFVRLTASYLAPGGRIVCMKGPGAEKELASLYPGAISEMFYVAETRKFRLPFSGAERNLVIIESSEK